MDTQTLKLRLATLRQKSKRALGLYKKIGRNSPAEGARLSEIQMNEWRQVSSDLCEKLGDCLEESSLKRVNTVAFSIRDHFHSLWRDTESKLHPRQRDLIEVVNRGDFIKAAILSQELIALRARQQASQAAYNEMQNVLAKNKLTKSDEGDIESPLRSEEFIQREVANVIPIRGRR